MKKSNKLQELVSNQIANAIETVKENKSQVTNPTKKEKKEIKKGNKKTSTPKSIKVTKEVTKEVTKQQNTAILEQVISTREVKYLYPEGLEDTLSRKRWRQQTRNELHKLEREMYRIKDHNSKEYKDAEKAYEDFKAQVLKPATVA